MSQPVTRRPRTLFFAIQVALSGALLAFSTLPASAEEPSGAERPRRNHRTSFSARCLRMYRAPNCSPIRKRSPTRCRTAIL